MAIQDWNSNQIEEFLKQKDIIWKFNPPYASHMGGVWERQIRSVRKVLNGLTDQQTLTDESLHTLLCQVESIINSRPLTKVSQDSNDCEALTPNHLLLLKGQVSLPLCSTSQHDVYARRRWRQVQHLSDRFWNRWTKEYLANLQQRHKWSGEVARKFEVGDLVLVVDNMKPRCYWPLGE